MRSYISLLGFLFTSVTVFAQNSPLQNADDSSHILNEVEITANTNPNKKLIYLPQSIVKLNEVELKRGTGLFLNDAINTNVPGVYMQTRSSSGGQAFNIRGYGNGARGTNGINSNFDNQGSKIYLNGIPVTDPEGITVLDDIDFGSIGNVEIIKGPAGSLYGLAIAGVVNLRTIKPEKNKISIGQDVLVGSYGLARYTTHLQIGTDSSTVLVNYGKQQFDGFMPHTASHKDFVNMFGEFQLSAKQSINAYFGYSNSYDERNGELTIKQFEENDFSGNPNYIKNNAHSEVIGIRAGVGHTYKFSNHFANTTSLFGSSQNTNASSAGGWTDRLPVNYGLRSTLDMKFGLGEKMNLSGVAGIETQIQNSQTIGFAMVVDSQDISGYNIIGAQRSNQSTQTKTTSVFTEWTLTLAYEISLTAGIGMSNMGIELNDRTYSAATNHPNSKRIPTHFENTYDKLVSPHVAINKVFAKKFSVFASYSTGYKAPVSSYFFIPFTGAVNTGLKPEKGVQFEVGTKGSLIQDRLHYQLAAFNAVFSDKMTAVAVANSTNTATLYSYVANGGNQDHKGLEALVS
ncbi:MAG: TonB-dependent receptor, partial [Sphingobacteriales bacterium]